MNKIKTIRLIQEERLILVVLNLTLAQKVNKIQRNLILKSYLEKSKKWSKIYRKVIPYLHLGQQKHIMNKIEFLIQTNCNDKIERGQVDSTISNQDYLKLADKARKCTKSVFKNEL